MDVRSAWQRNIINQRTVHPKSCKKVPSYVPSLLSPAVCGNLKLIGRNMCRRKDHRPSHSAPASARRFGFPSHDLAGGHLAARLFLQMQGISGKRILKKINRMQQCPAEPPRTIRWSSLVTVYHYRDCEIPRAETIAFRRKEKDSYSEKTRRLSFQCAADAIVSQRKKKLDQNTARLEKILPELTRFQWSHLSLVEMNAVESDIIEKLDNLRMTDAKNGTEGNLQDSREYTLIEKQFVLLLEACDCSFKLSCVDHSRSIKQHGKKEFSLIKRSYRLFRLAWLMPFKNCISLDVYTDADSESDQQLPD